MSLGSKLRNLRIQKGLTQVDLASGLVTPSMISQIETDKANPSYKILEAIVELGICYSKVNRVEDAASLLKEVVESSEKEEMWGMMLRARNELVGYSQFAEAIFQSLPPDAPEAAEILRTVRSGNMEE